MPAVDDPAGLLPGLVPETPKPGQESVWDYPRPPRMERVELPLKVVFAGVTLAETLRGFRVLETSHPPAYYFPPDDVQRDLLIPAPGGSVCEFKGRTSYWTVQLLSGRRAERAAWSYPDPLPAFSDLYDHFAFYASRVESCWVGDERVWPQPGDFYGGWITSSVVGPFKGGPGTFGW